MMLKMKNLMSDKRREILDIILDHALQGSASAVAVFGGILLSYSSLVMVQSVCNSSIFLMLLGSSLVMAFSPSSIRAKILACVLPQPALKYLYEASVADILVDAVITMKSCVAAVTAALSLSTIMSSEDLHRLVDALPDEFELSRRKQGVISLFPSVFRYGHMHCITTPVILFKISNHIILLETEEEKALLFISIYSPALFSSIRTIIALTFFSPLPDSFSEIPEKRT